MGLNRNNNEILQLKFYSQNKELNWRFLSEKGLIWRIPVIYGDFWRKSSILANSGDIWQFLAKNSQFGDFSNCWMNNGISMMKLHEYWQKHDEIITKTFLHDNMMKLCNINVILSCDNMPLCMLQYRFLWPRIEQVRPRGQKPNLEPPINRTSNWNCLVQLNSNTILRYVS